jgi:hypothetical protein
VCFASFLSGGAGIEIAIHAAALVKVWFEAGPRYNEKRYWPWNATPKLNSLGS